MICTDTDEENDDENFNDGDEEADNDDELHIPKKVKSNAAINKTDENDNNNPQINLEFMIGNVNDELFKTLEASDDENDTHES